MNYIHLFSISLFIIMSFSGCKQQEIFKPEPKKRTGIKAIEFLEGFSPRESPNNFYSEKDSLIVTYGEDNLAYPSNSFDSIPLLSYYPKNQNELDRLKSITGTIIKPYEPGLSIYLGGFWEPYNPQSNRNIHGMSNIVTFDNNVGFSDQFESRFINTFSEFNEMTKLDVSVSGNASYGFYDLDMAGHYSRTKSHFRSSNKIVWTLNAKRRYNDAELHGSQKFTLTSDGVKLLQKAIKKGDPEIFYKKAGRHIITSVTKESNFNIVYIIETSNAKYTDSVRASIAANFSAPNGDVSMSSDFQKELRKIDKSIRVDIEVYQDGLIDNDSTVSKLIHANYTNVLEIKKALTTVFDNMTWQGSKVLAFKSEAIENHYDLYELDGGDPVELYMKIRKLQRYQAKLIDRYYRLQHLLEEKKLSGMRLKEGAEIKIEDEIEILITSLDQLTVTIRNMVKSKGVNRLPPMPRISSGNILQYVDIEFARLKKWNAHANGSYRRWDGEKIQFQAQFWPIVYIDKADFISSIEFFVNGSSEFKFNTSQLGGALNSDGYILDFKKLWKTQLYKGEAWCWSGRWGEVCNPWAADASAHANNLKKNERGNKYSLKVIDIEGNTHIIDLKNASTQNF